MSFLTVRLESKLFLLFFQPLDLSPPRLLTDSRPSVLPPPGLVFSVIFAILTLNVRDCCRLKVRKVTVIFLRDLLVPPFFEYL
jgi:hypothetical protein